MSETTQEIQANATTPVPTSGTLPAVPVSLYPTNAGIQFCGGKNFLAQSPLGEVQELKKSDYGPSDVFKVGGYAYNPAGVAHVTTQGIWCGASDDAPPGYPKLAAVTYLYPFFYPVGVYTLKCSAKDSTGEIIGADVCVVNIVA